jgi:hypothetical protein
MILDDGRTSKTSLLRELEPIAILDPTSSLHFSNKINEEKMSEVVFEQLEINYIGEFTL